MNNIILASSSPYRAKLLDQIGIPYQIVVPNIDETPKQNEPAANLSKRLSLKKAETVAHYHRGAIIIGSDQVAELEGQSIEKPRTKSIAIQQMEKQSGKKVRFFTACTVAKLHQDGHHLENHTAINETIVEYRQLSSRQIKTYMRIERPYDCTGSFKAEGLGITLCAAIQSDDPSAIIGLPLIALINLLKHFKINAL